jgi:hypothetical protein
MKPTQWIGVALLILIVGGILYAFVRHGSKIKPDPDDKPGNPNAF